MKRLTELLFLKFLLITKEELNLDIDERTELGFLIMVHNGLFKNGICEVKIVLGNNYKTLM